MTHHLAGRRIRIVLVIAAVAVAALIFRATIFEVLIQPIGWLIWAGWRILAAIDRNVIWVSLLAVCGAVLMRLVSSSFPITRAEGAAEPVSGRDSGDRLAYWIGMLRRAERSRAGRAVLHSNMESMAGSIAEATRTPLEGTRELPQVKGEASAQGKSRAAASRIVKSIRSVIPGQARRSEMLAMERLLKWMEKALEINDEE